MVTEFGKAVRKHRVDREVSLRSMAEKLKVSPAYMSLLERGGKKIPDAFVEKVCRYFYLNKEQSINLRHLANISQPSLKMDLSKMGSLHREVANAFSVKLEFLSESQLDEIKRIVNGK